MFRSLRIVVVAVCLTVSLSSVASAHDAHAAPPTYVYAPSYGQSCGTSCASARREAPSIFRYGYRGLLAGGLGGLGVGYVVARERDTAAWRPLAFGSAVGALAGAGFGVMLGLLDAGEIGAGYYVTRDMLYGVGFGSVVGAIGGGLSALLGNPKERVLFGTAIGAAAGVGAGVLTGLVEAATHRRRHTLASQRRVSVAIAPVGERHEGWGATMSGTF